MAPALKADHFCNGSDSAVPDRANIVRLSISSRRKSRDSQEVWKGLDPEILQTERSFFSALGPARQPRGLSPVYHRPMGLVWLCLRDRFLLSQR
jgi:hypothetical protein